MNSDLFRKPVIALVVTLLLPATLARSAALPATAPALDPKLPTLWIVGDSTVHNPNRGQCGWGDVIADRFDVSRINIVNRARGGRSSRTFQTEGMWDQVLAEAKRGDFVLIQFGHNDGGPLSGDNRERGSIRGTGDETKEVTLTLKPNEGKKEVVHTYGWYMGKYADDARAKGLVPIICTPIPRVPKERVTGPATQAGGYRAWATEVAQEKKVPLIDLEALILKRYLNLTPDQIKEKYFSTADNTHTSEPGARLNAEAVTEGIKGLSDVPLRSFLKDASARS